MIKLNFTLKIFKKNFFLKSDKKEDYKFKFVDKDGKEAKYVIYKKIN
jgi:hypothetical protein